MTRLPATAGLDHRCFATRSYTSSGCHRTRRAAPTKIVAIAACFLGMYEVQVLDSYGNITYDDGQAAALYGQYPPLVCASRPPGVWQSYDIVFRRPRFDASGHVPSPAIVTGLHNGVLVQDHVMLVGPAANQSRLP